jgi:hypothetical protein
MESRRTASSPPTRLTVTVRGTSVTTERAPASAAALAMRAGAAICNAAVNARVYAPILRVKDRSGRSYAPLRDPHTS